MSKDLRVLFPATCDEEHHFIFYRNFLSLRKFFYFYGVNIEEFRTYCLQKKGVKEDFPFDEHTLVFKVAEKLFALTGLDETEFRVNLKCDPDWALELRETHEGVIPGYHMSKKHWNTVYCDKLPPGLLKKLVDHSYDLVVEKLPKKTREELNKG